VKKISWKLIVLAVLNLGLLYSSSLLAQGEKVEANSNNERAGTLEGNALIVSLVVEQGVWQPGGDGTPTIPILAFREEGKALQTPGPLLRVTTSTEVRATIRNAVPDSTLEFYGFQTRPSNTESVIRIPFGETATTTFIAGDEGAYFYWGALEGAGFRQRTTIDSQLSGAFIVDPIGFNGIDSILVLGEYVNTPGNATASQYSINGKAWPGTDRYEVKVGEINRWHLINPTFAGHPLHMHGFHYRVTAKGDHMQYESFPTQQQREVVTELVGAGQVASIEWEAVREGNWLFHCHINAHVDGANMISVRGNDPEDYDPMTMDMMSGMVVGIHATGVAKPEPTSVQRQLTMQIDKLDSHYGDKPAFRIAFNEAGKPVNEPVTPGPALMLNKDETVSIEVVNNLDQPTSIHWHGMELESFFDGVPGFSGLGASVTPPIPSGESFTVRMTPPRAGTFMYHTHLHDAEQLAAGLYGAMIVSDKSAPFDPELDRVFITGQLGENPVGLRMEGDHAGINGSTSHTQEFKAGQQYRMRLINITANNAGFAFWLEGRSGTEHWIPIAKDGAELPVALRIAQPAAAQIVSVGETFDFLWTPKVPGPYSLEMRRSGNLEYMAQAMLNVQP